MVPDNPTTPQPLIYLPPFPCVYFFSSPRVGVDRAVDPPVRRKRRRRIVEKAVSMEIEMCKEHVLFNENE